MEREFDVIAVGARCAGSPAAMLLARKGYRVLLLDRASFPSDSLSTHVIQPLGVAHLVRWGLLDRLRRTGCPEIHTYAFDFGMAVVSGAPGTREAPFAFCPRRTVLDKLLLDAAAEAGAEVREGFTVQQLLVERGRVVGVKGSGRDGRQTTFRAAVTIGADGRNSVVARWAKAEEYRSRPPLLASYYTYWSGLPMDGRFEIYVRPGRGFGAAPTHDGLTVVIAGWPIAEFEANRSDVEGNYRRTLQLVPEFAERLRGATQEGRLGGAVMPNFFRKPWGAGWVLVGDAGYHKDSITAQGITDAFREAEQIVAALHQVFSGTRAFDAAMRDYHAARDDRVSAMYEFTCQLATLEPPPPDMQRLIGSIRGNQPAMDGFARMNAGTITPAEFMSSAMGPPVSA